MRIARAALHARSRARRRAHPVWAAYAAGTSKCSAKGARQGSDIQWTRAVHFSSPAPLALRSALLPAVWAATSQALGDQSRVGCAGMHVRAPACMLYCSAQISTYRRHKSHGAAPRELSRALVRRLVWNTQGGTYLHTLSLRSRVCHRSGLCYGRGGPDRGCPSKLFAPLVIALVAFH